jgi:hypothetical protein
MNPTTLLETLLVRVAGDSSLFDQMMTRVEARMGRATLRMASYVPAAFLGTVWARSFIRFDEAIVHSMNGFEQFRKHIDSYEAPTLLGKFADSRVFEAGLDKALEFSGSAVGKVMEMTGAVRGLHEESKLASIGIGAVVAGVGKIDGSRTIYLKGLGYRNVTPHPHEAAAKMAGIGGAALKMSLGMGDAAEAVGKLSDKLTSGLPILDATATSVGKVMAATIKGAATALGGPAFVMRGKVVGDGPEAKAYGGLLEYRRRAREALEEGIFSISRNSVNTPIQLASALGLFARAGYDAAGALDALRIADRYTIANHIDLERATKGLLETQSALGLRSDSVTENLGNMRRITEVLSGAALLANSSVEQLADGLDKNAGAALRGANKSLEEGAALLVAYAQQGQPASSANQKVFQLIKGLERAALSNSVAWEHMGITVFEAGTKRMLPIADIMSQLERRMKGMTPEMKELVLMAAGLDLRASRAIVPLIGMSSALKTFQEKLTGTAVVEELASYNLQTYSAMMRIFFNILTEVGQRAMFIFLPYMIKVMDVIRTGLVWWNNLNPAIRDIAAYLLVAAAASASFFMAMSAVRGVIAFAFSPITTVLAMIIGLFTTMGPLIIPLIAALGGMALALGPQGLAGVWEKSKEGAANFFTYAAGFMSNFQHNWQVLSKWLGDNWQSVMRNMLENFNVLMQNVIHNFLIGISAALKVADRLFSMNAGVILANIGIAIGNGMYDFFVNSIGKYSAALMQTIKEQAVDVFGHIFDKNHHTKDFYEIWGGKVAELERQEEAANKYGALDARKNKPAVEYYSLKGMDNAGIAFLLKEEKKAMINLFQGMGWKGPLPPPMRLAIPPDLRHKRAAEAAGMIGLGAGGPWQALGGLAPGRDIGNILESATRMGTALGAKEGVEDGMADITAPWSQQELTQFKTYNLKAMKLDGEGGLAIKPPGIQEVHDKRSAAILEQLLLKQAEADRGMKSLGK